MVAGYGAFIVGVELWPTACGSGRADGSYISFVTPRVYDAPIQFRMSFQFPRNLNVLAFIAVQQISLGIHGIQLLLEQK